jgi:hypothetical protein
VTRCKFCSGQVEPEVGDDDTCESCWYGMRLEPAEFEADMQQRGVEFASGGHGFQELPDGTTVHVHRAPYRLASEPAPSNEALQAVVTAARARWAAKEQGKP